MKTQKLAIIGDLHGDSTTHLNIMRKYEYTLQLGDLGFSYEYLKWYQHDPTMSYDKHKFFPGNHDDWDECHTIPHASIGVWGDITLELPDLKDFKRVFFVAGALSVDRDMRLQLMKQGHPKQWWEQEQIAADRMHHVVREYMECKPDLMITHDCPISLKKFIVEPRPGLNFMDEHNRTTSLLQLLFSLHQPKRWIFGHYHQAFSQTYGGSHFTCLPECGVKELDLA